MNAFADATSSWPPRVLGMAEIGHRAFRGEDLGSLRAALEARIAADPRDAGAWFDLGLVHEFSFHREEGVACQARALAHQRVFRVPAGSGAEGLRLLMFVARGEIRTNVPVSFLLTDSDVTLDLVFVEPGEPLPDMLPDHDVAMVGVCESEANLPFLGALDAIVPSWPRPVLLATEGIRAMERDRLWRLLDGAPGIAIPPTILLDRDEVGALERANGVLPGIPEQVEFPFLLRPLDSHGGNGLERIDHPSAVAGYLERHPLDRAFFFAPFIDYSGADGLFRKYRVALIDGTPYLCHMAVASQWMLHYVNAGMYEDADKCAAESRAFETFDADFAVRHARAFAALRDRVGLEYITIDCAETAAGELLVFEAGTAMVVHDMDSPELYPYKSPNMRRIFRAFRELLARRAGARRAGARRAGARYAWTAAPPEPSGAESVGSPSA